MGTLHIIKIVASNMSAGIAGSKEQTGEEDSQKVLHHHGDDDDKIVSVMELDAELEYDLCKLWDASIDKVRNWSKFVPTVIICVLL